MNNNDVIEFIKVFQSPSNEKLFKEVACYWFATILSRRFYDAPIYYNPDIVHFATRIGGEMYDISGAIDPEGYYEFMEYLQYAGLSEIHNINENCISIKGGE